MKQGCEKDLTLMGAGSLECWRVNAYGGPRPYVFAVALGRARTLSLWINGGVEIDGESTTRAMCWVWQAGEG